MTQVIGGWSSNGHTRLIADYWYSGNILNVNITLETHWSFSGNSCTLTWSGSWAGSQGITVTRSNPSSALLWGTGTFSQGYNTTAALTFTITGFYDGSGSNASVAFNPSLGPLAPNAPTIGTDTYVSDTQSNITWSNNPASDRPYDNVGVYRASNTDPDALIVVLGGTATSYSDTGLAADHKYRHLAVAINSAGATNSAWSNYIYTTPAPPSAVSAAKTSSGDIKVDWTNASTYAADCTAQIQESTDGGTTWSANLATPAASAGTWTHPTPNPGLTHKYRVRLAAPSALTSATWTTMAGSVQLLARPNAPTGQTLAAQYLSTTIAAADAAGTITFGWVHNPVDSSGQSAFEVETQVSTDGGATWAAAVSTGQVTSTVSSKTYAANTFVNNRTIRWRVRTWGLYAGTAPTYSDWSTYTTITTSARPTAAVTGSGNWTSSALTQTGSYLDTEGSAQTGAVWTLKDNLGNTLETISAGAGEAALTTVTFATRVNDGATYTLGYKVRDGAGLWSTEATKSIPVVYAKPPQPSLTVAWSDDTGAVTGQITNPAGSPAVAYNVVYRDGVPLLALSSTMPNGTFADRIPPLNKSVSYTVVAVSALPSSSVASAPAVVTTTSTKVWLNGGPGMSMAVPLPYDPTLNGSQQRARKWAGYDTRPTEAMYTGVQRQREYKVAGELYPDGLAALLLLEDQPQTVCYRDPSGRKDFVGFASGVDYTDGSQNPHVKAVSLTLRACGYSE